MQPQGPFDQALNGFLRFLPSIHRPLEVRVPLLMLVLVGTILAGSAIALVPALTLTPEPGASDARVRPYAPLELAGFAVYVQEGCHGCHSQQIRDKPRTVARYGARSLAVESLYDYPMQWGSKRTGPDLARVGGKHSDSWQIRHLKDPRAVTPGSVMPPYGFLADRGIDAAAIRRRMEALRRVGVPYTAAMIEAAAADLAAQRRLGGGVDALLQRYPGAVVGDFTGTERPNEMDALVAYLQVLGTFADPAGAADGDGA